jgi:hypothetical protein
MQKLITVAVDITQLTQSKTGPISVTELDEINEILELGWQIEEWDFLKEGEADGKVILLVTLNDDLMLEDDEDEFGLGFGDDDENDFEEEEELPENNN